LNVKFPKSLWASTGFEAIVDNVVIGAEDVDGVFEVEEKLS
jgi:hypothetical protein